MLKDKNLWQNLDCVEEISDESASMIEGGVSIILIRDAGPVVAPPPPPGGSIILSGPNPTALQITNSTNLNLFYDLQFNAPGAGNNLSISPGQVSTFNGTDPTAIATWDVMLNLPGSQDLSQALTPGRRYEFYAAA